MCEACRENDINVQCPYTDFMSFLGVKEVILVAYVDVIMRSKYDVIWSNQCE